jgi:hypothetical protein
MSSTNTSILRRLSAWPAGSDAQRPVCEWADDSVLALLPNGAAAVAAAGVDGDVFEALAARADDPIATAAVMAVLARRLIPIASGWVRRGLSDEDLADAEADLVVEAITALRRDPTVGVAGIVQVAWHRVSGLRHTAVTRAARSTPLEPRHDRAAGGGWWLDPALLLDDAVAAGILTSSVAAAVATVAALRSPGGTSVACSPGARRKRVHRARRALRTLLATEGDG